MVVIELPDDARIPGDRQGKPTAILTFDRFTQKFEEGAELSCLCCLIGLINRKDNPVD